MTADVRFIEFVHARRQAVGFVLLGLAVACVLAAGYCAVRGFRTALAGDTKPDDPKAADAPPPELDPAPYQAGLAAGLVAALGLGGVGAFFLGGLPSPDADDRRRRDRVLLLVGGYVVGLALRACGLFLFVHWFGKLADWVGGVANSQKSGWWAVAALLQYLLGAGITFLAAMPARAEERNRPWIRRAVYAINFALTAVLLVVGLVLANAAVAMKAPAVLDTTESGFYTLTPETAAYVRNLKQPVKLYTIPSVSGSDRDQRLMADAGRLLAAVGEANPARVQVEQLSAVADRQKIQTLQQKYPAAGLTTFGVLVATGDNFDRYQFIDLRKMKVEQPRGNDLFVGEAELYRTLTFLIEKRATVYFTQASREPAIDPAGEPPPQPGTPAGVNLSRPATRLKDALERVQCSAKPLPPGPTVPADADVVVVADPQTALPEETLAALRKYMQPGGKDAKKGKLVVFAPARNAPGKPTVLDTGVEDLLGDYGMVMLTAALHNQPKGEGRPDWATVLAEEQAAKGRNPLALAAGNGFPTHHPRPIVTTSDNPRSLVSGGPAGRCQLVLFNSGGGTTWLEPGVVPPTENAWKNFDAAVQRKDMGYLQQRPVARLPLAVGAMAVDTEGKPAATAFGFGEGLADADADADNGQAIRLLTASVDWLRERPPAPDLTPKEYKPYLPKRGVSEHLLFTVPVAGTLLVIVLLGLGVWVARRK